MSENLPTISELKEGSEALPSVVTYAETTQYPPGWENFPLRVQQILTLLAMGHSYEEVGNLTKVTPAAIKSLVKRYDPNHIYAISPIDRRKIALARWEHVESKALAEMALKDMKDASLQQLATVAAISRDKAEKLSSEPEKKAGKIDIGSITLNL